MAVRRVTLDDEAEKILTLLARDMGLSASAVLERALLALRDQRVAGCRKAYGIYRELDLGPGGHALAPSTETRRGIEQVLRTRRR